MSQKPFIICDNLVKIYKVAELETVALQGLDLVVEPGELVGIVGVSGSGKTTLANILGGLDHPSAGRVWVGGRDLLKLSGGALTRYRRRDVGFVWQQSARNLIYYLNAEQNVMLPMLLDGVSRRESRQRAVRLLSIMGLGDRRRHRLAELSGGEQQRVAIAIALANRPRLLLADEPSGELDSATALTVYETFQTLNHELGITTLIVSHDPELARHVDRVVTIRDGLLASETVRPSRARRGAVAQDAAGPSDAFEELTVVDSAGRLQVSRDLLARFNIKGRVRLEPASEGILIRPALDVDHAENAEILANDMAQSQRAKRARWWVGRLRRDRKGRKQP